MRKAAPFPASALKDWPMRYTRGVSEMMLRTVRMKYVKPLEMRFLIFIPAVRTPVW